MVTIIFKLYFGLELEGISKLWVTTGAFKETLWEVLKKMAFDQ